MKVLGLSCFYHDAAAVVVVDGKVVAAIEEERFSRQKHDARLPIAAAEACLSAAGLVASELDAVAVGEQAPRKLARILERQAAFLPGSYRHFRSMLPRWAGQVLPIQSHLREKLSIAAPVHAYPHHLCHAASAFLTSPFEDAAVLVVDAVGEDTSTSWGVGERDKVRLLAEVPYPHSLGLLYTTITALLGFQPMNAEGTVMALAASGEPRFLEVLRRIAPVHDDGSIRLEERYFAFETRHQMYSPAMEQVLLPHRKAGERLSRDHSDLAASIQEYTNDVMLRLATHIRKESGKSRLCLAGGVALNSVANGVIARSGVFDEVFVPSAPGDAGCALGAALLHAGMVERDLGAGLGTAYLPRETENYLRIKGVPFEEVSAESARERTCQALANDRLVGWFQGPMEFGPRALGHRSILASPRDGATKIRLNEVKSRESFRPFGISILADRLGDFLETATLSPFMSFVAVVRPERRGEIPAAVHGDGTCRYHTVLRDGSPFSLLLQAWEQQTGLPCLINTSFNGAGEPLVCTPRDAWLCWEKLDLDSLYVAPFWIGRGQA